MTRTTSRWKRRLQWLAGGLTLLVASAVLLPAHAADEPGKEGKLDKSVDTESRNAEVQLRALQHEQYALAQYVYLVLFNQQFGDHITAERLLIPTVDADVEPAYVFSPKNLKPGVKYPGLVMVHGSYHGSLEPSIFGLIAAAVRKGYIVVFPEYRGSKGYGQDTYNAIDFGGKEVDDVIAAADYLAKTRPVAADRIGIYGRSKGGMIALLAIQRFPNRFAAAVDVVGIADMVAYMAYKPGFRGSDVAKQPRFGGKTIAQDATAYIDVSPVNHVDEIRTPLYVQATTGDKTAPVQLHAGRLIDILKAKGKKFEYKIYDQAPGGHIFSHVDSPQAREAEAAVFEFLGRYLHP